MDEELPVINFFVLENCIRRRIAMWNGFHVYEFRDRGSNLHLYNMVGEFGVPPANFDFATFQQRCESFSLPFPLEISFGYDNQSNPIAYGLLYNAFIPISEHLALNPDITWNVMGEKFQNILRSVVKLQGENFGAWLPNTNVLVWMPGFGGTLIQPPGVNRPIRYEESEQSEDVTTDFINLACLFRNILFPFNATDRDCHIECLLESMEKTNTYLLAKRTLLCPWFLQTPENHFRFFGRLYHAMDDPSFRSCLAGVKTRGWETHLHNLDRGEITAVFHFGQQFTGPGCIGLVKFMRHFHAHKRERRYQIGALQQVRQIWDPIKRLGLERKLASVEYYGRNIQEQLHVANVADVPILIDLVNKGVSVSEHDDYEVIQDEDMFDTLKYKYPGFLNRIFAATFEHSRNYIHNFDDEN